MEMLSRLGSRYDLEIETVSQPREAYRGLEYLASGRPAGAALMVGEEFLVQGCGVTEDVLEAAIRCHL
jgi:hypothetical protein